MGGSMSTPMGVVSAEAAPNVAENANANDGKGKTESESRCPVDHSKMSAEQLARWAHPWKSAAEEGKEATEAGREPQKKEGEKEGCASTPMYDVYGQKISGANFMPATPNQLPSPGQRTRLSTSREASTIPKGGAADEQTWTYPSAQMFWNALARKGKAGDVAEGDVDAVVAVHNSMNEKTWGEVLEWEGRYHCACTNPKLLRFRGRPDELSPAARIRMALWGYPRPFDRHDWVVDRCGKEEARYIIDYYYREGAAAAGEDPIEIHVRPAVDSLPSFFDRVRENLPLLNALAPSTPTAAPKVEEPRPLEVVPPADADIAHEEFQVLTSLTPDAVMDMSGRLQKECAAAHQAAFDACGHHGDAKRCNNAQVGVTYCVATQVCKAEAKRFRGEVDAGADSQAAYERMDRCVQRFALMANRVIQQARGVKGSGPELVAGSSK